MEIRQFYDKALAHASYAVLSNGEIILIDPGRDPRPYYEFAESRVARIVGVVETHPHADFVSSHKEISDTIGCPIYVSSLVGAEYHHIPFDEGDKIKLGKLTLKAINTPGHSPDSICVVVVDEEGKEHAIFTGDTLFVGDVGRPDLRENAGSITAKREELARAMYRSTREKLMLLPGHITVFPAHGAGSLCGRSMSTETTSTIGRELKENYALQKMGEDEFVELLLEDQPYVPKYFPNSVAINKSGARNLDESLSEIDWFTVDDKLDPDVLVVDTRRPHAFAAGHLKNSINIPDGGRFETWLGSIVAPEEPFHLLAADKRTAELMLRKSARIGYEGLVKGAVIGDPDGPLYLDPTDLEKFVRNPESYTVLDVRNEREVLAGKPFGHSINIPLQFLRERLDEIPKGKPVMVHCRVGHRSAIAASVIANWKRRERVYDLGEAILNFAPVVV
jgi:glyoxylase-like metal-dependent hydrolase (beta-lactamase superfamily II)